MSAATAAIDIRALLHPPAVLARGRLAHNYLERRFLQRPEAFVTAWFHEDPRRVEAMRVDLAMFVGSFEEAYDPTALVHGLPALRRLEDGLRARLLATLREHYETRFRVGDRLRNLKRVADEFRAAFEGWHDLAARGDDSAEAWAKVELASQVLHDILADPELQTRWIP